MPAATTAPIAHMGTEALNTTQQLAPNRAQQSSLWTIILLYSSPETFPRAQALCREELGCVPGTKHLHFEWQLPKYYGFWPLNLLHPTAMGC